MKKITYFLLLSFFIISSVWAFPPSPPVPAASSSQAGKVELATDAETVTGAATDKAVTPANLKAKMSAPGTTGDVTPGASTFTTLSVTQNFNPTKGSDVASANALTLGNGNLFDITGTTTINTIGTKGVGTIVVLEFDGILQLTHSNDLFLPTASNITTAAGDIAAFYEYATGDWRCMNYTRANGTSLVGNGDVSKVGTPANHQFGIWTGDGTLEGVTVTGSKVVCTDADGEPIACTNLTDTTYYAPGGTDVAIADGGTGQSTAAAAFGALKQDATTSATGVIELSTDEEAVVGTATDKAVTPANLKAKMSAPGAIGDDTPGAGTFTSVTSTGTANIIPQYETIFIPAASMTPCSTNGALPGTTEYVTNDINKDYLAFDATTEQYADVSFPMPEGWDRSTVKVKFYWTTESGSTIADTVEWEIAGVAVGNDDVIDTALGTAQTVSDAVLADNGTDLQLSGATPALTVGGTPALGDLVHWKVSRNVTGTDSCSEDAHLFGLVIQYLDNRAIVAW